jgi:hypothetical protein
MTTIINSLVIWEITHPTLSTTLFVAYALIWAFLLFDCLSGELGVDRLTWVIVIIAVPVIGPAFYLAHFFKRHGSRLG